MNATEFDVGPLTWVRGEIDDSLGKARQVFARVGDGAEQPGQLRFAATHLHQAAGAVRMVGLEGVARVVDEIETLSERVAKGEQASTVELIQAMDAAANAVGRYLDQLLERGSGNDLVLFPEYRALVRAGGRPSPTEVDLFFPDTAVRAPHAPGAESVAEFQLPAFARETRRSFQLGLLAYLRGDAGGLSRMRDALGQVFQNVSQPGARAFWWSAGAFLECLSTGGLDASAKPVLPRIDAQWRRLAEGSQKVAERLHREVLYQISRSRDLPEGAAEVAEVYGLARFRRPDEAAAIPDDQRVILRRLRDRLGPMKDAWVRLAGGHRDSLALFVAQSAGAAKDTEALHNGALSRLIEAIAETAARTGASYPIAEPASAEVAAALLYLDHTLEHYDRLTAEFVAQTEAEIARLEAVARGEDVSSLPSEPLLDEYSRRAQDRLVVARAVEEILENLRQAEEVLDRFFRNPTERGGLGAVTPLLAQVDGALRILDLPKAVELLGHARSRVALLANPATEPDDRLLSEVADSLSALGLYVDAVGRGRIEDDMLTPVLRKLAGEEEVQIDEAAETIESGIAADRATLAEKLEHWVGGDENARAELAQTASRLKEDAELVDDPELFRKAAALEALLEAAGTAPDAALVSAVTDIAGGVPEPAPVSPPAPEIEPYAVDAELLQVYLEEADEVLGRIAQHLPELAAAPHDLDTLAVIRRGFHTLKGSGRMVGLTDLGEVAWGIEQLLNRWLEQSRVASGALLGIIREAHDAFRGWVGELASRGDTVVDATALLARAEALRDAHPLSPPASVPAAEEMEAVAAEEIELAPPPETESAIEEIVAELPSEPETSPTLLSVFLDEAAQYLATLGDLMHADRPDEGHVRAAHTLAGISGTAGFPPIASLGHALEHFLEVAAAERPGLLQEARTLVGETLDALVNRLAAAGSVDIDEADDLIARLAAAMAAPDEFATPQPPVPEMPAAEAPVAQPSSAPPARSTAVEQIPGERRRVHDDLDAELLPVFLEEAQELVPQIGAALRAWRANPTELSTPASLQRALHTLKGAARMAGAMRLGELTHIIESRVLAAQTEPALVLDTLGVMEGEFDRLADDVEKLAGREADLAPVPEAEPEAVPVAAPAPVATAAPVLAAVAETEMPAPRVLRVRADTVDRLVNEAGEVAIARSRVEGEVAALKQSLSDLGDNVARLRQQLREIEIQAESQLQSRMSNLQSQGAEFDPLEMDRYTRLQELTRFMAESVGDLATLQLGLRTNLNETDAALIAQARLTRDLQQSLMRVRMVSLSSLGERMHRVVRQAAKDTGREAQLDLSGAQVEIDRGVLEKLAGPLEHLLRNAVAHGIERPEDRVAAGKPTMGNIYLTARQEGNDVALTLSDDGRGLDYAAIAARAREKGMIGGEVDNAELGRIIFSPGFSTADVVTQVAGRGVGLDVVKSEIAGLGGQVEVNSEAGHGTRFDIQLPLTLALTQALLVKSGGRVYALPATLVTQVLQLKPAEYSRLREAGGIDWSNEHYHLDYLPALLGYTVEEPPAARYTPVILLRSAAQHAAIRIDEIVGHREVVVKNIGPQLARMPGIAGATVLGDGRIILILNPVPLAHRAAAPAPVPVPAEAVVAPLVMVVDDSLTVRKVTSRLLSREGYRVMTAKDGAEALAMVQDIRPAVMLLDIEMPRMDGFELARNLRADPATADLPIIMITSRTAEKHRAYAQEIGVNDYLGKPYDEEHLLKLVARYTRQ